MIGRPCLMRVTQKPLPWQALGEKLKDRKGGRQLPQSRTPRLSYGHPLPLCSRVHDRHQGERARPSVEYLARTALGKATIEAFPAPSLFPFCSMALCVLKDLGDPFCPNPFISLALRKEGAEPQSEWQSQNTL